MSADGKAERQIAGFQIQVDPEPAKRNVPPACRARILDARGKAHFTANEHGMNILDVSGKNISGGDTPDVVFEGYSGGAHCCWTYWIVSLSQPPKLLRKLGNSRGFGFEDLNNDGKIELVAEDGAFENFDGLPRYASPAPQAILRLNGTKLERVDSEFWPLYEKKIADATRLLTPECAGLFRKLDLRVNKECDSINTRLQILTIVLNNLYGGREKEAWEELAKYWPEKDLQRERALILSTAGSSFLADPSNPNYGAAKE
ncbi:MAG TPA: hypothetical protein VKG84_02790 [Candidatus Acidoferrales bacterium]|nr:hypothetical protein [Candidatus Acidoferrales bacterium]